MCVRAGLETLHGDEETGKNQPVSLRYVLGGIAGEAIMVAGYFVYEAAALKLGMGAAAGVLANVGQGAVGLVIALVLMALLKGSKALDKLAVQW